MKLPLPRSITVGVGLTLVALGTWRVGLEDPPSAAAQTTPSATVPVTIYDPDPQHLWNRLHRALWVRTGPDGKDYGHDRLDPLLWRETRHLLDGKSHEQAIKILDEFLAEQGEKLVDNPLKRAILQRDLWAVFDWITGPDASTQEAYLQRSPLSRRALQARLARIIQRLALTPAQIKTLPDNYAAAVTSYTFAAKHDPDHPDRPFLPPDLFQQDGPWVEVLKDNDSVPVAPTHVHDFEARSGFRVFLLFPEGQKATLAYLAKLRDFPQPEVSDPRQAGNSNRDRNLVLNPELPQFPVGTQVALVRQLLLIDKEGSLAVTPMTEGVQLRVYRLIPQATLKDIRRPGDLLSRTPREQDFYEFTLQRAPLFAGKNGGLLSLALDDKDFRTQFRVHGNDEIEPELTRDGRVENRMQQPLRTCIDCHIGPGVHSFLTYAGGFFPPRPHLPRLDKDTSSARYGSSQGRLSAMHKRGQYSWGLLQGLWEDSPQR